MSDPQTVAACGSYVHRHVQIAFSCKKSSTELKIPLKNQLTVVKEQLLQDLTNLVLPKHLPDLADDLNGIFAYLQSIDGKPIGIFLRYSRDRPCFHITIGSLAWFRAHIYMIGHHITLC